MTVVGYTQKDIDTWTECMARSYQCRCDETRMLFVAYGYGLFTGGLGLHYEQKRWTVICLFQGNTKRQVQLQILKPPQRCTPSMHIHSR